MADISITATSFRCGTDATVRLYTAGASLTPGMPVYQNTSDLEVYGCDNDASASAKCIGIAASYGTDGGGVVVQTAGSCTLGGTLTKGLYYYVSGNAGGVAPVADVTSSKYVTTIGYASSTTVLVIDIKDTQVTV